MTLPITLPMSDRVLINPDFEQLISTPVGEWYRVFAATEVTAYFHIRGRHCVVALEPCPSCSNRGNWMAKLLVLDDIELNIDSHDGWNYGRYYFDKVRGLLEIEDWLRARKQLQTLSEETTHD